MAGLTALPLPPDVKDEDDDESWGNPALEGYTELPTTAFTEWDKVGEVKSALRLLRQGYFRDAALLWDQMIEDDRISGDLQTRYSALLGAPFEAKPGVEDDDQAQQIANLCVKKWGLMAPDTAVSELMRWGHGVGIGVGELVWDTRGDLWLPRLRVWHPQYLTWRWDTRTYWLTTQDRGQIQLPNTEAEVHSDGHWVMFTPYGFTRGWIRALVRRLAMPWLIRQWTFRDAARYSEVHGLPARKAITPADATAPQKNRFKQQVANLGNEPTILTPKGDGPGKEYDVQLLEATSTNYQIFEALIDRAEKSISITICGQDSSSRAQGGSLAQAKENIRDDIARMDAKAEGELNRDQIAYWFVGHNFGNGDYVPSSIGHNVEPPDDEQAESQKLLTLGQALQPLAAAGADARAILDKHGVPLIPEEEWNAQQEQKQAAADALRKALATGGEDEETKPGKKPPPPAEEPPPAEAGE